MGNLDFYSAGMSVPPTSTTTIGVVEEEAQWTIMTFHHHSKVMSVSQLSPSNSPPSPPTLSSLHPTPISVKTDSSLPAKEEVLHEAYLEAELPPSPQCKEEHPLECQLRLSGEPGHIPPPGSTHLPLMQGQRKLAKNKV